MNPTEWSEVKTQCLKEGQECQIVPKFWPRSQWGNGIEIEVRSRDEALRFFGTLGYQLRLPKVRAGGGHGGKSDGRTVSEAIMPGGYGAPEAGQMPLMLAEGRA